MLNLLLLPLVATIAARSQTLDSKPSDPKLIPEARQLLRYFHEIYGKKVLYGLSTNTGVGIPEYEAAVKMEQVSGKFPALLSIDLYGWNPPHWGDSYRAIVQAYVRDAKKWWLNRHGILTMQYHWGNPLIPDGTAWLGNPPTAPKVDVGKIVTEGTTEHEAAMKDLKQTADMMQELADAKVPVLFRPLHEIDGGWFWWTDRDKPENSAALYRMIHEYLVETRKFHNLVWVYSVGGQKDPLEFRQRFYPGSKYVDIAGVDIYSSQVGQDYRVDAYKNFYEMMSKLAPGKMLALCECNAVPNPEAIASSGVKWLYCLPWSSTADDNPAEWVKRVANDPLMITLDKLPHWHS